MYKHLLDPFIIPDITNVSAISLKNNYLFVGTQNGRLRLYARKPSSERSHFQYEFKKELEISSRYITEISWSPIATNKFAVISNANSIHIIEFMDETGLMEIVRKLEIKSPKAANSCVKWSNRNENLLLTCGFDGAIRVWNLSNESPNESFIKLYHCPMKCGLFLPTDEEVILCAGISTSLEFVDMRTEKMEESCTKIKRLNPRTLDNVQWATKASTRHDGKSIQGDRKQNKNIELVANRSVDNKVCEGKAQSDEPNANCDEVSKMLEKLDIKINDNPATATSIYMKVCNNEYMISSINLT